MTPETLKSLRDYFWIVLAIILLTLVFAGCRETRELKRDDKAFARVLTRPELLKRMDAELDARFPCQPITKTEYKEGKIVEVPVLIFDSVRVKKFMDSVRAATPQTSDSIAFLECTRLITESYNTAYKQAVWECNQKKPVIRVDTVYTTQIDGKQIDRLEATLNETKGMLTYAEKRAVSAEKQSKQRLLLSFGIGVGWLLSLVAGGWLFLRKKKKSVLSVLKPKSL